MLKSSHALAGGIAGMLIAIFWTATITSELFGSLEMVAQVKKGVVWGLLALVPALAVTGMSGMQLGRGWRLPLVGTKKKRMAMIAANGLFILAPSAVFLALRATAGQFDGFFYGIQILELLAGGINMMLIFLNFRDGLRIRSLKAK